MNNIRLAATTVQVIIYNIFDANVDVGGGKMWRTKRRVATFNLTSKDQGLALRNSVGKDKCGPRCRGKFGILYRIESNSMWLLGN